MQAPAVKAATPASQHASAEIRHRDRAGRRRSGRSSTIAREKLGIAPENLEPYGHYKAKVSMDYVKSLKAGRTAS